ncbi:uncharacterized protein LOC110849086 [Folsomia candida]|uniref:Uncharacterized protein n=1 Tax=Folsomia candida TaxID=158441 RepID=A0A226EFQ0_FOLCA|nr:uncharacterized protein LOC110849086 [Folsomia candida]OXA56463.1 hypothetical protein Fcan01_09502 [Folsomia candida]
MKNLRLSLVKGGGGGTPRVLGCLLLVAMLLSLLATFTEAKRSACWRYGHSCWGGHGKRNGGGGAIGQEFSSLSGDGISNVDVTGGPSSPPAWLMGLLDRNSGRILPLRMVTQLLRGRNSNYVNGNKVLMRSSAMHKVKREQDDEGVEGLGQKLKSGESESELDNSFSADSSVFVRDRRSLNPEDFSASSSAEQQHPPLQSVHGKVLFSKLNGNQHQE